MTKEQAKQKFSAAIYEATQILEDLVREGRLGDGNKNPQEELDAIRRLRSEWGNEAAEFLDEHWVSFDASPNEGELADAVEQDESNAGGDGNPPVGDDATVPGMDSAVLAAEERKRLAEGGEGGATGEGEGGDGGEGVEGAA